MGKKLDSVVVTFSANSEIRERIEHPLDSWAHVLYLEDFH
jgi:hypothetical protein